MPECRHHAICGLTDEADPGAGLCILHSHQADKDPDAFTTALRKHRETLGNRFTSMVFPKADFTGESFTTSAIFGWCPSIAWMKGDEVTLIAHWSSRA